MFVRTINQSNGKVSILIVENVREGDKVRQKKLRQVATVLPAEVERFRELAEYIKAEMEHERLPKLFPSQTLAEMVIIFTEVCTMNSVFHRLLKHVLSVKV